MFMAILTGIVADRIGVLKMLLPLISTVTLGMLIQTLAVHTGSFHLMLAGRLVFALANEPINLLKGLIVNDWFFGKEMNLSQSINLSFVRGVVFCSGSLTPFIES